MATVVVGEFEWDDAKAAANERKHGISFEEATEVFSDPLAEPLADLVHAGRFLLVGISFSSRLITVVWDERSSGARIRIISARRATAHERKEYEAG